MDGAGGDGSKAESNGIELLAMLLQVTNLNLVRDEEIRKRMRAQDKVELKLFKLYDT